MSESVSVAATLYDGRGKAQQPQQQQRQHQPRHPPLQQQQQQQQSYHQSHFYRDRSAAGRAEGDGENAAQQQQQQQRRSRRPRSIHITLRKTRAGSRPVNIQRNQHPYAVNSGDRVGSPTADAARPREPQPSSSSNAADTAFYQLVSDTTPPRAGLSATVQRDPASTTSRYSPGSVGGERRGEPTLHSPRVVLDAPFVQSRGSRAGSASDVALGQHGRVPSGGGSNTNHNNNANGGAGSSSSSLNGLGSGGGGSNCSVGPSSGSGGGGPSQQSVPQLNTFMKAPHATLQQLLPPGMKDRSGAGNSGVPPHPHRGYGASGGGGEDAFVPVQLLQQQGSTYGPSGGRLRSRSQVYISSSNLNLAAESPAGFGGSHRLRSNSSAAQHESLGGSYSGVLGDFVFPYPDRNATQAPPALRTPPAATAATIAANAPTLNFESRSPRLSPPVVMAGHTDPLSTPESHQHTRARSYTAGGSYGGTHHTHNHAPNPFHHHHRSSNTPVITASMAGVGGAALFTAHGQTASMGHGGGGGGENSTSRNLDQSLSMSSNAAGLAGTLAVSGSTSIMLHNNVNTSRSSLRSGTTRETTPVRATLAGTSATPTAQQQQQQLPSHPQRPTLTPSATGTPVPLGCSTRKSGSFAPGRSASLDVVNGLDDSVDSVLCGSSPPRRLSGHAAGPHRYLTDSVASDSGGQQQQQRNGNGANTPPPALAPTAAAAAAAAGETRRPRRYSTTLTDDDDNGNSGSGSGAPALSTLERLRSRRDTNTSVASGGSHHNPSSTRTNAAEPKTAIERWRAQEGERRRRAEAAVTVAAATTPAPPPAAPSATRSSRHRLSARQWRDAFRRLEEHRLQWTLRSFIGAGTSGKVYEGVLDNDARTPVAVKVLDVGVPMPVGAGSAGDSEEPNMSPAQQEALLVLLREVEMMERLHQDNIVTCLRCQVTPVHDRFMELHHQQQQQRRQQQQQQPRLSENGGAPSGGVSPYRVIPNAAAPGAATRVPVQVEIIMELCKRGTLASVVRRSPGGQLPVVAARRYLRDVLKGLAYLHRNNFIHRDVKGENVLISADDVAKLADFGCSRRIVMTNSNLAGGGDGFDGAMSSLTTTHATDSRYTTVAADYQWCEATGVAQTMVGTPMFMAPEIIQASGAPPTSPSSLDSAERHGAEGGGGGGGGEENGGEGNTRSGGFNGNGNGAGSAATAGYTASADIWSFGCLVLEVFGRTPWPAAGNNVYRLMKQIEQSVDALPPGVPPDTPAELLSVLRCCFYRDPHRRSTARMLLRSPWMTCKDEELQEMPPRRRR